MVDDAFECYVCLNLLQTSQRYRSGYSTELRCPNPACVGWVCKSCYRTARLNQVLRSLSRCGLCRTGPMLKVTSRTRGRLRELHPESAHREETRRPVVIPEIKDEEHARRPNGASFCSGLFILGSRFFGGFCRNARHIEQHINTCIRSRFFHILAACAHTWFVTKWAYAVGDWYRGEFQMPGCGPEMYGQGMYIPVRRGVYHWKTVAKDMEISRLYGPPTSAITHAMMHIGVPGMHAAVDACLGFGNASMVDIGTRWLCSAMVYVALLFFMMRSTLMSIMDGPSTSTGIHLSSDITVSSCSATTNANALLFAHSLSFILFTLWMSTSMRVRQWQRPISI